MDVTGEPRTISFGDFTVDFRLRELRRNGIRLKLPGQPFAVLAMLLERPGEVVTRDELRSRLWQQETFVDFDHSLNVAINKLREVLCDSAERSRFIETVPRLGYRFIAPLTGGTASPSLSNRAPDSSSPPIQPAQKPESLARIPVEAGPESRPSRRVRWYAAA